MSSWFPETQRTLLERCAIRILRTGHIPKHVAFIMDGNRRFAQKLNAEKIVGHRHGFEKLAESLSWCRDLGITQATLYAFSIENFKRPKNEVDGLMDLFRQQFKKLIEEFDKFESQEICVRVYGKIDLLPKDIQQSVAKVVLRTAKFTTFYLNVCFPYTAREEITNAVNDLKCCVDQGIIETDDINESLLSNAMYSFGLRDPDILIRTSGEIRFSDFLLWQSRFTMLSFVEVLWPDFTIWNLFSAVLQYQLQFDSMKKACDDYQKYLHKVELDRCQLLYKNARKSDLIKQSPLHTETNGNAFKCNGIKLMKNGGGDTALVVNGFSKSIDQDFERFMKNRNLRFQKCYQIIQQKRMDKLKDLTKECSNNSNNNSGDEIELEECITKTNDSNNNNNAKEENNGHNRINGQIHNNCNGINGFNNEQLIRLRTTS